jgi:hypothetical protein
MSSRSWMSIGKTAVYTIRSAIFLHLISLTAYRSGKSFHSESVGNYANVGALRGNSILGVSGAYRMEWP